MTDPPPPSSPSPGWYPDPTTSGRGLRWWDGTTWTESTSGAVSGRGAGGSGLEPVGDWMNELFRVATKRAGHFLPMIVVLILPLSLLSGLSLWLSFREAVLIADSSSGEVSFDNPSGTGGSYAFFAATIVLLVLASLYLAVAAARQTNAVLADEIEPWSDSMLSGLTRLPRATGVMLAIGAMVGVGYALVVGSVIVSPALVLLTFPLWVVGSIWVMTRFALAQVAASVAPPGVRSLGTSWTLTRQRFWAVLGRMVLLLLVSIALSVVTSLVATPFTAFAGGGGGLEPGTEKIHFADVLGDNPAVLAISQLFSALGNGASTVIWVVGLMLIYRDLTGPTEIEGTVEEPV